MTDSFGQRCYRVFPGEEHQLRMVRQWLAGLLPDGPARRDVLCVATELGTNAIRHTASGRPGGSFAVEIVRNQATARVTVTDQGAPQGPRLIDDPDAEHGRGLLLVAGLSSRTGVAGDHRGRLVWAEIPWLGAPDGAADIRPVTPSQALGALFTELAARGRGVRGMTVTRFEGTLTLYGGPAVRYRCGWLTWPAGRLSARGRPLLTVHNAADPAGAARRLAGTGATGPDQPGRH
jgi:serine/threonine-protein kinase RsbW